VLASTTSLGYLDAMIRETVGGTVQKRADDAVFMCILCCFTQQHAVAPIRAFATPFVSCCRCDAFATSSSLPLHLKFSDSALRGCQSPCFTFFWPHSIRSHCAGHKDLCSGEIGASTSATPAAGLRAVLLHRFHVDVYDFCDRNP